MCQKESFPDYWKVAFLFSLYFRILGRRLRLKTAAQLVSFLCLVKSFKKFQIIDLLITSRNMAPSYSQYGFRSSRSTADLLRVVSDRIARAFYRFGATRVVALGISRYSTGCDMWVILTNSSFL